MARTKILRLGREAEKRVDLHVDEELDRLYGWIADPVNILGGVEPDLRGHQGEEHRAIRSQTLPADALAF